MRNIMGKEKMNPGQGCFACVIDSHPSSFSLPEFNSSNSQSTLSNANHKQYWSTNPEDYRDCC